MSVDRLLTSDYYWPRLSAAAFHLRRSGPHGRERRRRRARFREAAVLQQLSGDFGLRDSRTVDSTTATFTWDINQSIPQVIDDGTFRYVYGLGRIARVSGAGTVYFLPDGLGSTMALTDDQGDVVGTYDYDVFGAVRTHGGSSSEFSFTGEQNDPNGLEYLRNRYYETETGRFLSRDPLPGITGLPVSQNRYLYVLGNPTNLLDPSGLCVFGAPCPKAVKKAAKAVVGGAETVGKVAAQTVEEIAYGMYVASHEALSLMGELPDPLEVPLLPIEIYLTGIEAGSLGVAAAMDYLATGNYTNVYNDAAGRRKPSDWWPDWLLELLGKNPTRCYPPCTKLPGISPKTGKEGGIHVDFQWPLGK